MPRRRAKMPPNSAAVFRPLWCLCMSAINDGATRRSFRRGAARRGSAEQVQQQLGGQAGQHQRGEGQHDRGETAGWTRRRTPSSVPACALAARRPRPPPGPARAAPQPAQVDRDAEHGVAGGDHAPAPTARRRPPGAGRPPWRRARAARAAARRATAAPGRGRTPAAGGRAAARSRAVRPTGCGPRPAAQRARAATTAKARRVATR